MKRILLIAALLMVLAGCSQKPIGGERDEHGCLGPAGYAYDEQVGACTRNWEITSQNQKTAANIAVNYVGQEKGLTVFEVLSAKCTGCFVVKLTDINHNIKIVNLDNWRPAQKQITNFDECADAGYPVMESYPRKCQAGDITFVEQICDDKCGDNICQKMVCMGTGCPCAETEVNCPIDCT